MKLLTALGAEMLKTKRTASFYFTLVFAAPIPLIFLINVLTGGADLGAARKDPLNEMFSMAGERTGLVFFPIFVILVCTLLPQIEYRNNTWKQVFASPKKKSNLFLAKFININLLMLLFLVASLVFMSLVIVITHFVHPEMDLLHQPFNAGALLQRTANAYVTILALCAFQFWLGIRFRNFIIPTAVGLVLWITGMMLVLEFGSNIADYFPYSFQVYPYMAKLQPKLAQVSLTSVAFTAAFLFLGFLDFRRRRLTV
jgi:lantibiotic transport system permease protein